MGEKGCVCSEKEGLQRVLIFCSRLRYNALLLRQVVPHVFKARFKAQLRKWDSVWRTFGAPGEWKQHVLKWASLILWKGDKERCVAHCSRKNRIQFDLTYAFRV